MYKNLINFSARVDFQAALLAVVLALGTAFSISWYYHTTTHEIIRVKYEDRAKGVIAAVESYMPEMSFKDMIADEDMNSIEYIEGQKALQQIKEAFDVLYLFSAGVNEKGEYIYLIDGLDPKQEDFRPLGDLIEVEIIPEMQRALNDEIVYPEEVKATSWGNIYISYFPWHSRETGEVIGVVGIEFQADDLFRQYTHLKRLSCFIVICVCIIAVVLSNYVFKRMDNPHVKDVSLADPITLMRNRNAYTLAMHKIDQTEDYENRGIIIFDVEMSEVGKFENSEYIKHIGDIIVNDTSASILTYRIKDGHFVFLTTKTSVEEMEKTCRKLAEKIKKHELLLNVDLEIYYGYALFINDEDQDLNDTRRRADYKLYQVKSTKTRVYNT